MQSLVLELQREAAEEASSITGLLRKALIVSTKLSLEDFRLWIIDELEGYKKGRSVPEYRRVTGEVKAWNSVRREWIPFYLEEGNMEFLRSRLIGQRVSEIEDLVRNHKSGGSLHMPFPPEIQYKLADHELGLVPTLLVQKSQIVGILDAVRNVVLEWSLRLERDGILGEGMSFSSEEKEKAASQHFEITNFQGVIGNVQSAQLQIGNYSSIHSQLKELGIPQKERNELESILDELQTAKDLKKKSLAAKGMAWVMKNADKLGGLSDTIRGWFDSLTN